MNEEYYNGSVRKKSSLLMRIAGVAAALAGIIEAFFGLYVMMINMQTFDRNMDEAMLIAYRKTYLLGVYVMIMGVAFCIAGFYGAVNSGVFDNRRKIIKYAAVICAFSAALIVLLCILGKANTYTILASAVFIFMGCLYFAGALHNKKELDVRYSELTADEDKNK